MTNLITFLPLHRPAGVADEDVIQACGLILPWVRNALLDKPLQPQLEEQYGFPVIEMTGGTIHENGLYSYPEDPDLKPLVQVIRPKTGETFWQYDYGIIAIRSPAGDYVTRMD